MVSVGEKLNLRCPNFNLTTWYKDEEALLSTSRIRINKQLLKFKYVKMEDTGVYSCRLESNETVEWRNVTVRVENLQNDGYQNEGEDKSGAMNVLRPEDGSNDLETETRSELSDRTPTREASSIKRDINCHVKLNHNIKRAVRHNNPFRRPLARDAIVASGQ